MDPPSLFQVCPFVLILFLFCNLSFSLQDYNVKSLLYSLIYCRSSMTAEQVSNAECFLVPKGKSTPNSEKDTEYNQYKEKRRIKDGELG